MLHRLGLALTLALFCMCAGGAERRYVELDTPELTLISAAGDPQTRQIALQIGMFRAAVEQALGVTLSRAIPMRIYALSEQDWKQYFQPRPGLSGYFLSNPFSSDLLFDSDDSTSGAYELMFHEYVHYILRTFWAGEVPAFLDEGLAEVLSTAQFHGGSVRLEPRLDYVQFLRDHEWLPFERLLEVKRRDPEYVDHSLAPAFYAQAWATMYYAMAADPAFGARVTAYLRDLNGGSSRLSAAERLIGGASAGANLDIARFIRRRERLPIAQIEISGSPAAGEQTLRWLNHDESTLALGELMLRFGNRHEKALDLFEQVSGRRPDDPRARIGIAWAYLQARDWSRATTLIDEATEQPVADPAMAVALGRAIYQLVSATIHGSDRPNPDQRRRLVRARALFDSALNDKAARIEAITGYVLTSLALEEADESLIVLTQIAYRTAPGSSDLAVALAILHELTGQKSAARKYWQEAARNTQTGPMRARIMNALQATGDNPQQPPR